MFFLKSTCSLKCFAKFSKISLQNSLLSKNFFRFSTEEQGDDKAKTKVQPKILQKIRKADLKKQAEKAHRAEKEKQHTEEYKEPMEPPRPTQTEPKMRDVLDVPKKPEKPVKKEVKPVEEKKKEIKTNVRGEVQPYFLNKSDQNELSPNFSIAKLMEYNSSERRNKIKHVETTLLLNKDLSTSLGKSQVRRKITLTKEELVRELPKNL